MPYREGFEGLEKEILAEKAAALARIAGRLEGLLAELERLGEQIPALSGPERERSLESHRLALEEARLYRWYLDVQREAVGLRRHEGLDRLYPLPPPIVG
jgi:hypothetical protein